MVCTMIIMFVFAHFATSTRLEGQSAADDEASPAAEAGVGGCAEPAVANVCTCTHYSVGKGFQCSGCKDKKKWGYGCDLDCPADCKDGCDFSGNCHPPPPNCKRNSRIKGKTEQVQIYNDQGDCAACVRGFHGPRCESPCPEGCDASAEGVCTRAGNCFKCKKGYYGEVCKKVCPRECPNCVMKDNMVPSDPNDPTMDFMPAGSCPKQCVSDHYGNTCDQPCPENCDKARSPSCYKAAGTCRACQNNKFFGQRCETPCPSGCQDGKCGRETGKCTVGCVPGFYSGKCSLKCPKGTGDKGCGRHTALPVECITGMYPGYDKAVSKKGLCLNCPENCKNGMCNNDGTCHMGCDDGYWGATCDAQCPHQCADGCDVSTGHCFACLDGYTGKTCNDRCHPTCASCQFGQLKTGPSYCASCHADRPAVLRGATCDCMAGASRKGPDGQCECDEPPDPNKQAYFQAAPERSCRVKCKKATKEIFAGTGSQCVPNKLYKSVVAAQISGFTQGNCSENEYEIAVASQEPACLQKEYVETIAG